MKNKGETAGGLKEPIEVLCGVVRLKKVNRKKTCANGQ